MRFMTILAVLAGFLLTAGCGQKADTAKQVRADLPKSPS
jgi:nitrous oxide reductase accessory protein NosL